MTNIAVIGSGYWGKNLVRNFYEIGALHTICDSNPATLNTFKGKYPEVELQQSFQYVLDNNTIDAVAIATPAEAHFEMVKMSLLANKHVFVEKPLALFAGEAEELQQLSLLQNRKLMIGHILLYHPAMITLKKVINSGELGKINYIYSNRLNLGKIRSEENILWSFAPHDISAMLFLLEEMPSHVIAMGGNYLNRDITDVTMTMLSFKSGVKGHIFVSWLHPDKEQKLIIVGDKKMAVFDDTVAQGKLQIHDKGVDWINRQPVPRKNGIAFVRTDDCEPLKAECEHFVNCIESDATPRTDGINGIKVLKILNACQDSLMRNGAAVTLNGDNISNPCFIHETAIVDTTSQIGNGTKIWHFSHVMSGARLGNNCSLGQNVVISPDVKIGNNVKIQNNVSVYSGVTLQDDVFCGPSMVFTNVINPRSHVSGKHERKNTLVKKGATIGANATIVCGNTIGKYAFIGAGAIVTKDVPDYALMMGTPAKIKGWVCECGDRLRFQNNAAACDTCNKRYEMIEEGLKCLACSRDSNFETHRDKNTFIDRGKLSHNTYDEELTLPQGVDYCSIH